MTTPKVSVCIDVYNYAAFLPEAVESVLRQDFTDFEVIISDDCSTDRSFEIAREYAAEDERIVAVRNPVNLGMVKNRNACLRLARGEYVKILHADDFLNTTEALGKMAAMLDLHPGMSLAASGFQIVGGTPGHRRRDDLANKKPVVGTTMITRCLLQRRNLIGPPSATMFRRAKALRGFDEGFFNSADWEMWLHLLEQGCFGYLSEPLVCYRQHADQQTEKDRSDLTEKTDALSLLNRYLDKPYVRLSGLCKASLRHRALAEFAARSRQLGRPDGKALIARNDPFRFYATHPLFTLYEHFSRQQRWLQRILALEKKKPARRPLAKFPAGLNVAGFFQGEYGIGDSSRAYGRAISESGLPSAFLNIHSRNHRNLDRSVGDFSPTNPYSVNLMTFSFDYARRFSRNKGGRFFRGHYNIALWYWELEKFPARWHACFEHYDEIWTATHFCQRSLIDVSPIPVHQIGYPFFPEEPPAPDRAGFGFREDTFLFFFNFDFHSVVERKNPEGLIAAFGKAFPAGTKEACLILKSINAQHHPERAAELERLSAGLNIVWINEHLDGSRLKSLFATVDCYISLHRSEGLGLGMAQAMSYGKPVITTGYSGNMDFTTPENSLLVRYQLAEIATSHGVYEKGNFWAEPDTDHAAALMRQVYEKPAEAALMGQRARRDLREVMNPEKVLARMRDRLGGIDPRFTAL